MYSQSKMPKVFARTTAPDYSVPLVTLEELKAHTRLPDDLTDDDGLLTTFCATAEKLIENQAEIALREQVWTLKLKKVPCENLFGVCAMRTIRLEITPINSVTVAYYDTDDVLQTVDSGDYELEADHAPPILQIPYEIQSSLSLTKPLPLIITANCGVTDPVAPDTGWAIPSEATLAICELVAHWYKFREAVGLAPYPEHGEVYRIYSDLIDSLRWRLA